jgi:hypothetical protein
VKHNGPDDQSRCDLARAHAGPLHQHHQWRVEHVERKADCSQIDELAPRQHVPKNAAACRQCDDEDSEHRRAAGACEKEPKAGHNDRQQANGRQEDHSACGVKRASQPLKD